MASLAGDQGGYCYHHPRAYQLGRCSHHRGHLSSLLSASLPRSPRQAFPTTLGSDPRLRELFYSGGRRQKGCVKRELKTRGSLCSTRRVQDTVPLGGKYQGLQEGGAQAGALAARVGHKRGGKERKDKKRIPEQAFTQPWSPCLSVQVTGQHRRPARWGIGVR